MLDNAVAEGHSLTDLQRGSGTRAARKNRYGSQKPIRKNSEVDNAFENNKVCIYAFEVKGSYAHGTNEYHPNGMHGAKVVVTKENKVVYVTNKASNLPDDGKNYKVVQDGVYNYFSELYRNTYVALKHNGDWDTWKYGEVCKGNGFNIHTGEIIQTLHQGRGGLRAVNLSIHLIM